jgi:hypothetical protein
MTGERQTPEADPTAPLRIQRAGGGEIAPSAALDALSSQKPSSGAVEALGFGGTDQPPPPESRGEASTAGKDPTLPRQGHRRDARYTEIDIRYGWQRRQAVRPRQIGPIRIRELERLFQHRYRSTTLPDDDSGREDLRIVVEHFASMTYSQNRTTRWARKWAPWMPEQELEQLVDEAGAHPRRWKSQSLGEALRLTYAERTALKITTIQCVDKSLAEVADLQREQKRRRDRERQRRKREAARKAAEFSPNPIELSMRAVAVFSAIGKRWKSINSICRDVAGSPAFEGLSRDSLKMTVHRIIKKQIVAQYIERKIEQLPGRLKTKVRRPPMVP